MKTKMFTKLRNKFLILNMSITSIVVIAAFAIIYFITYTNINSEINKKLYEQPGLQVYSENPETADNTSSDKASKASIEENEINEGNRSTVRNFSLNDPRFFSLEVDTEGKILRIDSLYSISTDAYYKAADMAWKNKESKYSVTIEGKQWRYAVAPVNKIVIQGNGQQNIIDDTKFQIIFLDVTESNKSLFQLLMTLLIVGMLMLLAIFIISIHFANRAIKPFVEAWEKQKQFVADASHELKTPLSIVNSNYDALMANQDETIKSQIKWLDYIKIGTDRMTKLINDLLSLARLEDSNTSIKKMPFNISESINEVILSMEALVSEKGITLTKNIEPDIVVKSDPERVKQLAVILLDNAIKYTDVCGQIDISLSGAKRQVICSIKNSGKGIRPQDLPRIFDRFYRADPSRTHATGGYGLGLSIAKQIVEILGGEIHSESEENGFTTFTFRI